ncbi:MAG: hypothetical protein HOD60_12935 [Candidatus Nitrosopelagicus sp.]|jgi:hypothetical protein|nr:hypothetical protein [Candidatus Nitrosopelagicus sp.]
MKSIVIISIAVVLLIPLTVFAQESANCPPGAYHGLDNSGNDACRDVETNKVVKTLTESSTSSSSDENPLPMFFKSFVESLTNAFPVDSIDDSVGSISNSIEMIIERMSHTIEVIILTLFGR